MVEQDPSRLDAQSEVVCAYLANLQGVITRMASNSAACKHWCITLVAAILVIVLDKDKPLFGIAGGIPVVVFVYLDAYYLRMERQFRNGYNRFVATLHAGDAKPDALYQIVPVNDENTKWPAVLRSDSIRVFYGALFALTVVAVLVAILAAPVANSTPTN